MSTQPLNSFADLYKAQNSAMEAFAWNPFSPYSSEYIQSQVGIKGYSTWISSKAFSLYEGVKELAHTLSVSLESAHGCLRSTALGKKIDAIVNTVFPVNQVNGKRQFIAVSKEFEKFLGQAIFHPIALSGMVESYETMRNTNETIANRVNDVFSQLQQRNQSLLNPAQDLTRFDYRVTTVVSGEINAFALPGGSVVVYSEIVKHIENAVLSGKIRSSTVEFADGSTAVVDLSSVTTNDVLAALLGHEITHSASRHSMLMMTAKIMRYVSLKLAKIGAFLYIKSLDKKYTEINAKPYNDRTADELRFLMRRESQFSVIYRVMSWMEDRICSLANLFHSRRCEFEADVTGAYLAKQSGYNPLGALYLQEVLSQDNDFFHKNFEFLYTHPYKGNRKRALLAAIHSMDSQLINSTIKERSFSTYANQLDSSRLSLALASSRTILQA